MDYQRVAERIATSLLGTIEHGASLSTCLVTDLTSQGARLRVSATQPLPTRFTLRITRIDRAAATEIRWRNGEEVGVAF